MYGDTYFIYAGVYKDGEKRGGARGNEKTKRTRVAVIKLPLLLLLFLYLSLCSHNGVPEESSYNIIIPATGDLLICSRIAT